MRRRIVICWEVREAVNANSCKAESQLGCVTGARLFATEHARHLLHCRPGLEACLGPLPQATRLRASPSRRRDSPRSSTAARPNVLFVGAGSRLGPFAAGGFHTVPRVGSTFEFPMRLRALQFGEPLTGGEQARNVSRPTGGPSRIRDRISDCGRNPNSMSSDAQRPGSTPLPRMRRRSPSATPPCRDQVVPVAGFQFASLTSMT